ncbi:MAG: SHOCT domain-containing protein [Pseudoxanthomonas mexicana]|nr:SHOCT domain-containing protein [Pseudoxanthomonas mexicana]
MGGISLWHWIILFLFFVLPVCAIGGLAWFLIRRSRAASSPPLTTETRLQRLDDLFAKGAITQGEHERQRADILRRL